MFNNLDNNINGMKLPIVVKDKENYISVLENMFNQLKESMNKPAFKYEAGLRKEVEHDCNLIINALKKFTPNNIDEFDEVVEIILKRYLNSKLAVSELDKCYAFKGVAAYYNLHSKCVGENFYNDMLQEEISFFRARLVGKTEKLCDIKEIISLPFSKCELVGNSRFSSKNKICLYLGVTSYVCAEECGYNNNVIKNEKDIYMSALKFNSEGKKLKILNLVISEDLINGIYDKNLDNSDRKTLQNDLIKIFPLILATSFVIKDKDSNIEKYEYLLSQSIVRTMKKVGIDGVAYLSMRINGCSRHSHGVNLAIPMLDDGKSGEYSYLYKYISCTKPVKMDECIQTYEYNKKSYVNKFYPEYLLDIVKDECAKILYEDKHVFYGNTLFSKFDDYLWNQQFYDTKYLVE